VRHYRFEIGDEVLFAIAFICVAMVLIAFASCAKASAMAVNA